MRVLVLLHEGAPMAVDMFAQPLRSIILDHPDDDADLWSVWQVPPIGSVAASVDITEQFALTWAMDFAFGPGVEPAEYLAAFPAFVREAARAKLIALWQRRMAEADANFVPVVLKSARAA